MSSLISMLMILFVCVNYFTDDAVLTLARMFDDRGGSETHLAITNNGSNRSLGEAAALRHSTVYESDFNLGYFGGLRYALKQYGNRSEIDAVVLTNPDVQFDIERVSECVKTHATDQETGVVAPRVISTKTNRDQNPFYLAPPSKSDLARLERVFSTRWKANLYIGAREALRQVKRRVGAKSYELETPHAGRSTIFAPHGSFMIFTQPYLSTAGAFDHPSFLFLEELFVGFHCANAGLRVIHDRSFAVHHTEHATTKLFRSDQMVTYQHDALLRIIEKYDDWSSQPDS